MFIIPDLCGIKPGYPRPKDPNIDPNIPPPGCRSWNLAVAILTDIGLGLGGIVGYVSFSHRDVVGPVSVSRLCQPSVSAYLEILIYY